NQLAALEVRCGEWIVDHRDARTGERHTHEDLRCICRCAAWGNAFPARLAANERPYRRIAGASQESQSIVLHERFGFGRSAPPRNVRRCGIETARKRSEPARRKRRI